MILTGPEIAKQVKEGRIEIDPFDPARLNPNSYNFRLGPTLKVYEEDVLDPKQVNRTREFEIPLTGFELQPDRLYLGSIAERIGSDFYVPLIKGRSSIARLGLFIVITADLVDQGAHGNWTLQMHAIQPLRVYPNMEIGQITFWVVDGEPLLYDGKYQGLTGPGESQAWQDFR